MGGWVGYRKVEEIKAVRTPCWSLYGWVGGWVGGWLRRTATRLSVVGGAGGWVGGWIVGWVGWVGGWVGRTCEGMGDAMQVSLYVVGGVGDPEADAVAEEFLALGGWVGGWVVCFSGFRMRCWMSYKGRWVGGWVGGWVGKYLSMHAEFEGGCEGVYA